MDGNCLKLRGELPCEGLRYNKDAPASAPLCAWGGVLQLYFLRGRSIIARTKNLQNLALLESSTDLQCEQSGDCHSQPSNGCMECPHRQCHLQSESIFAQPKRFLETSTAVEFTLKHEFIKHRSGDACTEEVARDESRTSTLSAPAWTRVMLFITMLLPGSSTGTQSVSIQKGTELSRFEYRLFTRDRMSCS